MGREKYNGIGVTIPGVASNASARYIANNSRSRALPPALSELEADQLAEDVRPFLERPADRVVLTKESLAAVLETHSV
jgi:hypothetical protein